MGRLRVQLLASLRVQDARRAVEESGRKPPPGRPGLAEWRPPLLRLQPTRAAGSVSELFIFGNHVSSTAAALSLTSCEFPSPILVGHQLLLRAMSSKASC